MEEIEQEKPIHFVDTHSQEIQDRWQSEGKKYRRKIMSLHDVKMVTEKTTIETRLADGTIESSVEAKPGDRIVTGSAGERFVVTSQKFDSLYRPDGRGGYIPRERRVLAMNNPYHEPISILAPWSTEVKPEYQHGGLEAMLVVSLDDNGGLTNDRYIIGNEEMLGNVYEQVEE